MLPGKVRGSGHPPNPSLFHLEAPECLVLGGGGVPLSVTCEGVDSHVFGDMLGGSGPFFSFSTLAGVSRDGSWRGDGRQRVTRISPRGRGKIQSGRIYPVNLLRGLSVWGLGDGSVIEHHVVNHREMSATSSSTMFNYNSSLCWWWWWWGGGR